MNWWMKLRQNNRWRNEWQRMVRILSRHNFFLNVPISSSFLVLQLRQKTEGFQSLSGQRQKGGRKKGRAERKLGERERKELADCVGNCGRGWDGWYGQIHLEQRATLHQQILRIRIFFSDEWLKEFGRDCVWERWNGRKRRENVAKTIWTEE